MDTRSPSGRVDFYDFRLVLNMDGSEQRGYCRLGGWQPYLHDSEYGFKNQDLHDQMVGGQYYQRSYTYSIAGYSVVTGYQYPVFYPPIYVGDYEVSGGTLGPFCGYVFDTSYPTWDVTNQWMASNWFIGHPYAYVDDLGCMYGGSYDNIWNIFIRDNSESWTNGQIEFTMTFDAATGTGEVSDLFPSSPPGIATHKFEVCMPADANNFNFVILVGDLISGPTITATTCGSDLIVDSFPCTTDDCYRGSFYYLAYDYAYTGYTIAGYTAGDPIPVYNTFPSDDTTLCYPELYYLQSVCREAITALFPVNSVGGRRRLIAATRSRIYVNDDKNGNWRILADGLGGGCERDDDCTCSPKRFKIAALGNTVLFTNGIDPVLSWEFDDAPGGVFFWSADYVAQLRQLDIDTADVVQAWNGFAFIANVTENGDRFASRVYWSDYNSPTSWIPGGESLAGFHDFGNGETVLAMEPIGGRLRVFTDKSIYDCILVRDPEQVFSFQEIYRGPNVLRFRHAMVNTGDALVYLSSDSIFVMSEYDRTPQRIEWIHRASGVIYEGVRQEWVQDFAGLAAFDPINRDQCDQAVGGWDAMRQAIWFSWPTGNNVCPNMSLVLWPRYQKSSIVDHGFTAFTNYQSDFRISIRDWMADSSFCQAIDLILDKEGLPYQLGGTSAYEYLCNSYESPAYPCDPDSAIASQCGVCLFDLCLSCDSDIKFLMASAADKTISEFTPDQHIRVRFASQTTPVFPETGVATYTDAGYYSLMQGDPYEFKTPVEKRLSAAAVSFVSGIQTTPNLLNFSASYGAQPECQSWHESDFVDLSCLGSDFDEATNERPGEVPRFAFHSQGTYLGWRMWVDGTGGSACFNTITFNIRRAAGCW